VAAKTIELQVDRDAVAAAARAAVADGDDDCAGTRDAADTASPSEPWRAHGDGDGDGDDDGDDDGDGDGDGEGDGPSDSEIEKKIPIDNCLRLDRVRIRACKIDPESAEAGEICAPVFRYCPLQRDRTSTARQAVATRALGAYLGQGPAQEVVVLHGMSRFISAPYCSAWRGFPLAFPVLYDSNGVAHL
jgi:hypothetical protein